MRRKPIPKKPLWPWLVLGVVCISALLLYSVIPGFVALLIILVFNFGASVLKRYTAAAPIDLDFLAAGVSYLAAFHGLGFAIMLAVAGPPASEYVQSGIGEFVWIKIVSVLVTALAVLFIGTTPWALFGAVLLGLAVQYVLMLTVSGDVVFNAVRRITNAAFSGYLLFLLVPLLH